jgi:hypothetical protein
MIVEDMMTKENRCENRFVWGGNGVVTYTSLANRLIFRGNCKVQSSELLFGLFNDSISTWSCHVSFGPAIKPWKVFHWHSSIIGGAHVAFTDRNEYRDNVA